MKLDVIPEGPGGLPVVRLFLFNFRDVGNLIAGLKALASGVREKLEIHGLHGVEVAGGTRLLLRAGLKDKGMVVGSGGVAFECILTPEGWDNVVGLVEPFLKETKGFQWLVEMGEGKWLLSVDGQW